MVISQKIRTQGNFYDLMMGIGHTVPLSDSYTPEAEHEEKSSALTSHIPVKPEVLDNAIRKEKNQKVY